MTHLITLPNLQKVAVVVMKILLRIQKKSDLDFCSEGVVAEPKVERYFTADEGLYSMTGLENGSPWVHHLIRRKMKICI